MSSNKKRSGSQPPQIGNRSDDLALVGGPDDPNAEINRADDKAKPTEEGKAQQAQQDQDNASQSEVGRGSRLRSSSACCIGFTNIFKRKKSKTDINSQNNQNEEGDKMKGNQMYDGLKDHFTSKLTKDRQFMVQLVQQSGIEEDMLEYLNSYFSVKQGEFSKSERDLISVTFKKIIVKARRSIQMLEHLVEQPRLKRYESNMKYYLERQKDELKTKLSQIVQMIQTSCLPNSSNHENKSFFLSLVGDYYRYQIELINYEEGLTFENMTPIQKKQRHTRDLLIQRATDSYQEAFNIAATYLNPCNTTRLSVTLNFTIFLAEFKKDKQKALTLSEIIQELAHTRIDDSAQPSERFTDEENELIASIQYNIELWRDELAELALNEQESAPSHQASGNIPLISTAPV